MTPQVASGVNNNLLQQIENNTDGIETSLANLETYTDGLETLLTAIQGFVDNLEGYTDDIETKLDTIITNTNDLDTNTDGIEALITAGNALLTTINTSITVTGLANWVTLLAAMVTNNNYLSTLVQYQATIYPSLTIYRDVSTSYEMHIVDRSDTTNYPHSSAVGDLIIRNIFIHLNSNSWVGGAEIFYLTNVGGTDGDKTRIWRIDQTKKSEDEHVDFEFNVPMNVTNHVGQIQTNDTSYNTGSNLTSNLLPGGAAPSGDGDLVIEFTTTSGSMSVVIFVEYDIE